MQSVSARGLLLAGSVVLATVRLWPLWQRHRLAVSVGVRWMWIRHSMPSRISGADHMQGWLARGSGQRRVRPLWWRVVPAACGAGVLRHVSRGVCMRGGSDFCESMRAGDLQHPGGAGVVRQLRCRLVSGRAWRHGMQVLHRGVLLCGARVGSAALPRRHAPEHVAVGDDGSGAVRRVRRGDVLHCGRQRGEIVRAWDVRSGYSNWGPQHCAG